MYKKHKNTYTHTHTHKKEGKTIVVCMGIYIYIYIYIYVCVCVCVCVLVCVRGCVFVFYTAALRKMISHATYFKRGRKDISVINTSMAEASMKNTSNNAFVCAMEKQPNQFIETTSSRYSDVKYTYT